MYTTLLGVALDQCDRSGHTPDVADRFADLLRCRARLVDDDLSPPGPEGAMEGLTHRLAYDVSLLTLVRGLGVPVALGQFDGTERRRLEQVLIDRGLPLDVVGGVDRSDRSDRTDPLGRGR